MNNIETMKLALEALKNVVHWYQVRDKNDEPLPTHNQNPEIKQAIEAIAALRQAIEQTQPAEKYIYGTPLLDAMTKDYVSPSRQPLTDEEIQKCYETTGHYQTLRPQDRFAVFALARAIEAAHGIKGKT